MDRGMDFLKSQVGNAVMRHQAFLENLKDHESQADDPRFRDLCTRFIPTMQEHQRMLEQYQKQIGAEAGVGKRALGKALAMARDLADAARESDFLRLVGDIVASRQSEDTFRTFREGGRRIGDEQLAQIGEIGERHHDDYARQANRIAAQMFVEHVQGVEPGRARAATADTPATVNRTL